MATINLTDQTFESSIADKDIVLVDFWAPWCGPCRQFGPVFETVSENNPDITFAKVNTQEEESLAGALQIRSIPTLMVLREGVLIYRQPGALPANTLDELIAQVRKLDMDKVRADMAEAQAKA